MTTKRNIGEALESLTDDVKRDTLSLVQQYRSSDDRMKESLMRQAIDTPHRARAQIAAWIAGYDAVHGSGSAVAFMNECLTAAGSTTTLADINTALAALEAQAQTIVDNVLGGWTWARAATAIETALTPPAELPPFSYSELPLPAGYITVWGGPH